MATVGGSRDESRPFDGDPTVTQDGTARLYDGHSSFDAAWRACKDGVTNHDTTVTVAATTTNDDDRNSKSTYNCSDRIAGWAGLPG